MSEIIIHIVHCTGAMLTSLCFAAMIERGPRPMLCGTLTLGLVCLAV